MTDIKGKVVSVLTSAPSNEGIWCNGDILPHIIILSNRRRWVVTFQFWKNSPQYPLNSEVNKPHSQSAASIFRVQQNSLQLGYRQIAMNMVTQTHSRGRKMQAWYRPMWKIKNKVWEERSERMAVSLEAHSIQRPQLLYIILGFTVCLFSFFHTTYIFMEQQWNRFHFLHHILLCLPCPLLSIVWGVYWLGYSQDVGRDFFCKHADELWNTPTLLSNRNQGLVLPRKVARL